MILFTLQVDAERYTTVNPLEPPKSQPHSALLGAWTLAYASNGEPETALRAPHANIIGQVGPTTSKRTVNF